MSALTLGFQRAEKFVRARNGKKVNCTFEMSSFSTLGLYPVSIMVGSTGEVQKPTRWEDQIDLIQKRGYF